MNIQLIGSAFDKALAKANTVMAAIPDDIDIDEEFAAIEAAYAPVETLAKWIIEITLEPGADQSVKLRAQAWLDGQERLDEHRISPHGAVRGSCNHPVGISLP